jgi:hypothetical protein
MLHAKIAPDITTVTTLPVLSALNCGANRKSARAMTPAKHHSATSPLDVRPSGIAHTVTSEPNSLTALSAYFFCAFTFAHLAR